MTKDLIATFGKSDGGTHNWKYKDLDPNLTAPQIKEACELLTNLDICTQNGVKLFDSVVTAKVLTHKETLIFDPEHETRGVRYDGEPVEETVCEEVHCCEVAKKQEEEVALPTPKLSALPTTPYGRYFRQLSTIETSEKTAIKVEKESLLQSRYSETNDQHPTVMPLIEDSSNKDTKEQNRLLQWLHRIRKKNKEGPPETPRK
ncbi:MULTISPECIES: hypothetical protein [Enterococcus]|uniref:DUF2922 family protein n=1 Tax=Enterococcus avium ATCC 14025 TaxID=1140002 RepID=A0AAV3IXX5_ENTAV|nr:MULTISPECIES: hypothetical protein [Enterococcus]EOT44818.1 hypothetical protein OMU_02743 [Enterococcus avium ATCC 14025]EOU21953.1 hypothetical protein I570_02155 [Enterococcus avium ATCC 14025]MBX9121678.1 hypothetical protein [Enterococcus sp. K18_3]MDB1723265.1 hypothetical protein [Enterococcus avium]MDU3614702.1 hypothetical protein [Enterococcus avium]